MIQLSVVICCACALSSRALCRREVCQVLHRHVPAARDQVNIGRMIRHKQAAARSPRPCRASARSRRSRAVMALTFVERLQHGRLLRAPKASIMPAMVGSVSTSLRRGSPRKRAASCRRCSRRRAACVIDRTAGIGCIHAEKSASDSAVRCCVSAAGVGEFCSFWRFAVMPASRSARRRRCLPRAP